MGPNRRPSSGARIFVSAIFLFVPAILLAQRPALMIEDTVAVPGEEFIIFVRGDLERSIRGFQAGMSFPSYGMEFVGATLEGATLGSRVPEIFEVTHGVDYVTFKVLHTGGLPTDNFIPAGSSVPLLGLRMRLHSGLEPGGSYEVDLESGLGIPSVSAFIYEGTGWAPPASMMGGVVNVIDKNILRMRDVVGVHAGDVVDVEFSAYNIRPMKGFSIGIRFDPSLVQCVGAGVEDTITEAVGVEYVAPIFDNANGSFILGVLLDYLPPYEDQLIPATGMELTIAKVQVQVLSVPATGNIDLVFEDGLGNPPIRNLFVIEHQSIPPLLMNGRLAATDEGPFIRGDSNRDGRVNISDPIATAMWFYRQAYPMPCEKASDSDDDGKIDMADMLYTLYYLFTDHGTIIPPPYPASGMDPTPDDLPCPR
jgi:hypothetical protein